jgi:hypothetical protein
MVSQVLANAILNQKAPDILGSFREGQEFAKGQQVKQLAGEALQAGGGERLQELIGLDPEVGYALADAIGARNAKELNRFIADASIAENLFKTGNALQGRQFIQQSRDTAAMIGSNTQTQDNLLRIFDTQGPQAALNNISAFTSVLNKSKQVTSSIENRESEAQALVGSIDPRTGEVFTLDTAKQALVRLDSGIDPRAGSDTAAIRAATDPVLGDQITRQQSNEASAIEIAKLTAQGELAPRIEGDKTTATRQADLSANVVEGSFESIGKANRSIRNIDTAIKAIDDGASTGFVQNLFPSITTASIELRQIKNELGLDVIGSVTFGALSEGELALALDTALPPLSGPALRNFLVRKKEAQKKLISNMQEAVTFLSKPGSTISDFIALKGSAEDSAQNTNESDPLGLR